jgi:hypothetical protein
MSVAKHSREHPAVRPLTPDPSPTLGRGGPNSFWVFESRGLSLLHELRNDALEDLPNPPCDLEIHSFEILGALRIFGA